MLLESWPVGASAFGRHGRSGSGGEQFLQDDGELAADHGDGVGGNRHGMAHARIEGAAGAEFDRQRQALGVVDLEPVGGAAVAEDVFDAILGPDAAVAAQQFEHGLLALVETFGEGRGVVVFHLAIEPEEGVVAPGAAGVPVKEEQQAPRFAPAPGLDGLDFRLGVFKPAAVGVE